MSYGCLSNCGLLQHYLAPSALQGGCFLLPLPPRVQNRESPAVLSMPGIAVAWEYQEGKLERKLCFSPDSSKWGMLTGGCTT